MHTSSMNARESEYIEHVSVHSAYVHVSVCVFFTHRAICPDICSLHCCSAAEHQSDPCL